MALVEVTVLATFKRTDDSAATGTVTFVPTAPLTDGTDIVGQDPVVSPIEDGEISAGLMVEPPATTYHVLLEIDGATPYSFEASIPSSPTTVQLGSLMP